MNKGYIYKISSSVNNKIYIGSTIKKLAYRLSEHKSDYKRFLDGNFHNITSFEIVKLQDCNISLIEEIDYDNHRELRDKERYYIELNKDICVNKLIPNRTNKEYYQANKEKYKEKYQANKEKNSIKEESIIS